MTRLRRKRRSTGVLDSARVEYVPGGHAAWEPHRAAFFTLEHFSRRWRLRSRRTANDRRALFILRAATTIVCGTSLPPRLRSCSAAAAPCLSSLVPRSVRLRSRVGSALQRGPRPMSRGAGRSCRPLTQARFKRQSLRRIGFFHAFSSMPW